MSDTEPIGQRMAIYGVASTLGISAGYMARLWAFGTLDPLSTSAWYIVGILTGTTLPFVLAAVLVSDHYLNTKR